MVGKPGSISHGTMREEDLIPKFTDELDRLCEGRSGKKLVEEVREMMVGPGYYGSDLSGFHLEELFDALGEYAPYKHYFGAHEGDGSDYGFWPIQYEDE